MSRRFEHEDKYTDKGGGGLGGGGGRHWVLNWIVKKINLLNETTVDLAMLLS